MCWKSQAEELSSPRKPKAPRQVRESLLVTETGRRERITHRWSKAVSTSRPLSTPLRGVSSGTMASSPGIGGFDHRLSELFVRPTLHGMERVGENKPHKDPCTDLSTSLMCTCCWVVLGVLCDLVCGVYNNQTYRGRSHLWSPEAGLEVGELGGSGSKAQTARSQVQKCHPCDVQHCNRS